MDFKQFAFNSFDLINVIKNNIFYLVFFIKNKIKEQKANNHITEKNGHIKNAQLEQKWEDHRKTHILNFKNKVTKK